MNRSKQVFVKWAGFIVVAVFFGFGSVLAFSLPGFSKNETVKPINGVVTIPVGQVEDGKAHFYQFADGGKNISFFVVKGTDGAFHVAFDACDVCFQEKKGYFQEGDFMICRNCSKKFATNKIGRVAGGGCNPSHLNFAQDAKAITIKTDDLKLGARFF